MSGRKPEAMGHLLDTHYFSQAIQDLQVRAIATLTGVGEGYPSTEAAAQDLLNLLYTAMALGAFPDWESRTADLRFKIVGVERGEDAAPGDVDA